MLTVSGILKKTRRWTLAVICIAAVLLAEELTRLCFGGTMTIRGLPIAGAEIRGEWRPDFMWIGRAWTIEMRSDAELKLILDGRICVVPRGSHVIYSNHDHTNTDKFGEAFWGYPEDVEVRL